MSAADADAPRREEIPAGVARAAELRAELDRHNRLYYVLDEPEVGDDVYDELLNELRDIEREFPSLRTPDSPTQRVGAPPLERFEPVTHHEQMLSLANARNEEELRAWETRLANYLKRLDITASQFSYTTEPKIDGLAITLTYENGVLVRGATSGDGRIGEDVTQNLRTIGSVPLRIADGPELVEVRGEAYLPIAAFKALNERRAEREEPTFANPRNSAAGSIRQLDPKLAAERPLSTGSTGSARSEGSTWRPTWTRSNGCRSKASRSTRTPRTIKASRVSSSAATGGRSGARSSTTRSTASSSRSTSGRCGASSAWSGASRAGRSPGSFRRRRRRRRCTRSSGTSGGPGTWCRSRCWSRSTSAASPSPPRPSTTRRTSRARTCATATRSW